MDTIQGMTAAVLKKAAARLHEGAISAEIVESIEHLAEQVYQVCVVAIVGQVKAGKSTFINAFLGEHLAKVGTTETTATINYFRYGQGSSGKPVHCFWRSGRHTDEDLAFLDSLQGNDEETLRKADNIHHLEYYLLNPALEHITLVDTPGTGAVLDEHQNRTAEFLHLHQQLRERHDRETQEIGSQADAIIYVLGPTAYIADRDFLEEFSDLTRGKSGPFNAIGVMTKVDFPDVIERRAQLSTKIANQLRESLNTVVPISAGIQLALEPLLADGRHGIQQLAETMRNIPHERLEKLLANEEFYLTLDSPDYPPIEKREELLGATSWSVFTTIVRVVANPSLSLDEAVQELRSLAGFDQLKKILDQRFLARSHILRCYRIIHDARRIVNSVKYKILPELRKRSNDNRTKLNRFLNFIRQTHHDQIVARELQGFVQTHLNTHTQAAELAIILSEVEQDIDYVLRLLEHYNADTEALHQLFDMEQAFSSEETDELKSLFGLYGLEVAKRLPPEHQSSEYVQQRQRFWRQVTLLDAETIRCQVANQAISRYGLILEEMLNNLL